MMKIMEKPIPSFIIVFLITFLIATALTAIFQSIFNLFAPNLNSFLAMIVVGLIIGILYIYIFKINDLFSFSNSKMALILLSPSIIFIISNMLDIGFAIPTTAIGLVTVIISGFGPGIFEEVMFRGIVISYLMKFFRSSKYIIAIVFVSALIFGIVHLFNGLLGAPVDFTIFQFFYSFAMAVLFGAVYLRTGNLWIPIILHSINDIFAFCCTSINVDGISTVGFTLDLVSIIIIIASIISIILGFYYVRSSKHDDIIKVWNEKWAN